MEWPPANAESRGSSRARRDSSPILENVVHYSKRKADGVHVASQKRRRLDLPTSLLPSVAGLPGQVWQHVFLFLPPVTLGRLLRVNRAFYTLLTSVDEPSSGSQHLSTLPVVSSNFIWLSARKAHFPTFPRPLMDMSELAMWRLLGGRCCQFCAKTSRQDQSWTFKSAFEDGPGLDGVRIVWPFGVRTCGRCLEAHSQTEQSLLFAVNSALLAALPYVFVTQNLHVVPSTVISSTSSIPTNVKISKWYWRDHVRDIQRQSEEARSLGPAAGEEWLKGLEHVGKQRLIDAERWERWERTRGMQESGTSNSKSNSPAPPPANGQQRQSSPYQMPRQLPMNGVPRAGTAAQYSQQYSGPSTDRHMSPQYAPTNVAQRLRPERNIRDANEAKAARKSEIERRCQDFDPPLLPSVLRHMKAFQAACQISAPLTEKAWEMLKPRLEAERKGAEDVEHERAAQMATLQIKLEDRRHQDASLKEVREVLEREWEEVQRPVRERLGAYADEIIQRDWAEGRALTKENCPNFAADLLMEVRRRFYDDQARDDEATHAAGQDVKEDPPTGPPTRRLILENMKWVFDNKVKPQTEQFRKELFLCSGDGCEGNSKWYGFEGIIQHFGAKHTTAFSVGNVVVCWKEADWPEDPPFHPDPARARQGFYSNSSVPGPAHSLPHPYPYPYPGYAPAPAGLPPMAQTPHPIPQHSPVPFGQYGHPSGPFPPPQAPPAQFYGPPVPQSQPFVPPPGPVPAYSGPPQASWQEGPFSHDVSPQFPGPAYSPPGANFAAPTGPVPYGDSDSLRYGAPPSTVPGQYGQLNGRPPYDTTATSMATSVGPSAPKIYQDQIQALIDVARDLWTSTSGVKYLNQSVRLSVVIHHILYHFNLRFGIEPSLDLLADALDAHHSMYPINAVAGLRCKACAMGFQNHAPPFSSSSSHDPERNFPSLLSLILHFKSEHMGGIASSSREQSPESRYDWKKDMIDLPDEGSISALIQSPGMDDNKLRIIAEAFPKLFPSPLPHIGVVTEDKEATRPAENFAISPRPPALADDRTSSRHDPSQGSQLRPGRPGPATGQDFGKSPASRSSTLAPRPVSRGAYEPHDGQPRPSEVRSASRMSRRYEHPDERPEDRRMRVYHDEPGYYVSRDFREREYDRAWRDPYGPLSSAAVRRYSHYGRMYEGGWERPPAGERYYIEHDDPRVRPPTRSGLRYLDRPEFSVEPPATRHESRPRDLEESDARALAREPTARASAAPDVAADADRFLDDLDRDRTREYVSRAARDEAQEAAEDRMRRTSRLPDEVPPHATENPDEEDPPEIARNGAESQNGRATLEPDPAAARFQAPVDRYYRDEEYRPSPRYEPEPRGYAYGPSRYRRYSMYHDEPYYEPQRFVRARGSRFSRYEATRRRLEQSKSPTREGTAQPERRPGSPSVPPPQTDKHGGEPQPRAPAPPRDYYHPYDERDRYARRPPSPLLDYRYAEMAPARRSARPEPAYVNEYGELVEYVRVHDPYYADNRRRYVPEAPVAGSAAPLHRGSGDPRLARYYEYADHDMHDPRDHRGDAGRYDYHGAIVDDDVRYAYYERERDSRDRGAYYSRGRDMDVVPMPRARESVAERDFDRERDRRDDYYGHSVGPPEAAAPPTDGQRQREDRRGSFAGPPPPPPVDEREGTTAVGREREDGGEE
ncbi:uncharacterized protein BKA78DRAFT_75054 [Phyllosticta capitalensis]|uniref:uncharacterized protein n=1 Tax=Phyllosticta capitalensis TaxID=121624 RepID=UPI00312FCDF7